MCSKMSENCKLIVTIIIHNSSIPEIDTTKAMATTMTTAMTTTMETAMTTTMATTMTP